MRKIPQEISRIIIDTLPKDITDAIYIFGSYATEFFDEENSDIDIAWFTNKPVDYSTLSSYEFDLCVSSLHKYVRDDIIGIITKNTIEIVGL